MSKELIILIIFVSVVIFVVTFDFIWSNTKTWLKVSSEKVIKDFSLVELFYQFSLEDELQNLESQLSFLDFKEDKFVTSNLQLTFETIVSDQTIHISLISTEGLPLKHFLLLTFYKDLKEFITHLSELVTEEEEKGFVAISQLKGKPYKDLQLSEKKEFWLTHFSQMKLSQFLQKYNRNIFLVAEQPFYTVAISKNKSTQDDEILLKTLEILAETNQLDETNLFVYEKDNRFELEEELTSNNSQYGNLISEAIAGEEEFVVVKRKPFISKGFQEQFDSELKLKEYFDYLNRH
jgi:hypothetical protein